MAMTSIRDAIWGKGSITTQNTVGLSDIIYDAQRDAYINTKTGVITAPSQIGSYGVNPTSPDPVRHQAGRLKLLSMRLRIAESAIPKGFTDLHTTLEGDRVFVFIVLKGKALTLEDDAGMFPSDTLVTQIRLLME